MKTNDETDADGADANFPPQSAPKNVGLERAAMSAVHALKAARAAGVRLGIDGEALTLEAAAAPPPAVLDLLARHKTGVVALLRTGRDGWSGEDWRAFFDERAGIAEFDGGLPRATGRGPRLRLLRRRMAQPQSGALVARPLPGLRQADQGHDPLLPFGTESTGHAWLHSRCWSAWHAGRKAEAVAALEAMGIATPAGFPDDFGKNGGA